MSETYDVEVIGWDTTATCDFHFEMFYFLFDNSQVRPASFEI